jgi:transposase
VRRLDCEEADPQPWLVDDDLWARIEPLIPKQQPRLGPGRRPVDDRKVLCGILFVLYTGIRWEWLPGELGFGCGMTCWRRLQDWNNAGVWQRLHELLLAELRAATSWTRPASPPESSALRSRTVKQHGPLTTDPR